MNKRPFFNILQVAQLTAPERDCCSDQATLRVLYGRSGKGFPVGKVNGSQTATIVVMVIE